MRIFFFSSRRRHTRYWRDWSSDVCSSDLTKVMARVKEETGEDAETAIMDAKYGFIHGALQEAQYETGNKKDTYQITHLIDGIITNKYLGFPIFLLFLFIMFTTTFVVGQVPMDWIDAGVAWLGGFISN